MSQLFGELSLLFFGDLIETHGRPSGDSMLAITVSNKQVSTFFFCLRFSGDRVEI